ncbi:MAG: 30S ribosomal protein S3 [Promethearchaeota archaeon]
MEVEEVENPDLDAQIMSERLAYSLDRGRHYRRAGYYILRKVMDAGARGVEIIVSGKVTSQRARTQIFRAGTMKKSGMPAQEAVDKGVSQCIQKSGVLGVVVKIMRADYKTGDGVKIKEKDLEIAQKQKESKLAKLRQKIVAKGKIEEEEVEGVVPELQELIEDVDEEDIKEVSLESTNEEKK